MKSNTDTTCFHCGNDCEEEVIKHEDKDFCCIGCRSVYLILSSNNLCEYYNIEDNPGIELKEFNKDKFDFLDDVTIQKSLFDFENEKYITATFYLPQIHCYSCLWLLEMLNKIHEGITKSKVNYLKKELSITFKKEETSLKEVVIKLTSIGYEPLLENKEKKKQPKKNKHLLYQLGIAGFCFGNIMFLAFPEYLALENSIDQNIANYIGYISLALATLLVGFSANHYFKSAIQSLKFKKINLDVPISLGIATIYISSAFEIVTHTGTGYLDSLSGLVFFLLLGRLFQNKTFDQFDFERDYRSYFPLSVRRKKEDDTYESLSMNKISIGDTIKIIHEEVIPTDSVLMSDKGLIDYSFVTGESFPETATQGEQVFAGGRVKGDAVLLTTTALPSQSYLTKLWDQSSIEEETNISKLSNKIASWFTIIVLFLAVGAGAYWGTKDFSMAIKVFTSILIVACPCALALAIPITYGNALRLLGNKNFYLKNAWIIEKLSSVSHLIFDKSGTLTVTNKAKVGFEGKELSEDEKNSLGTIFQNSNHPLSRNITTYLNGFKTLALTNYIEHKGQGIEGNVGSKTIKVGSAKWILGIKSSLDSSEVHLEIDGDYRGYFRIENVYRKNLKPFFETIKNTYKTIILSGDNDSEKTRLQQITSDTLLYFNQSPHSKKAFVEDLQDNGNSAMMVGDGLNDAGALISAHIGVAISENTSNFTPASDVILDAKDLQSLPQFLLFSRWSVKVVYVCFGISFLYNIVGLFFAVQGKLSPIISAILMPISSISVLLVSLGLMWLGKRLILIIR